MKEAPGRRNIDSFYLGGFLFEIGGECYLWLSILNFYYKLNPFRTYAGDKIPQQTERTR